MTRDGATAFTAFASGDRVFRQVMDVLTVAVYMTDAEGRLTYFNPAAARLSGRTPEIGTDK
jgi:PAS domain S-box-containing protein